MFDFLRSSKRNEPSDDEEYYEQPSDEEEDHVDTYIPDRTFDLAGDQYELLDDLASYDESDSYDVCVLRFTQSIPVLHWSIYLQSQSEEGGPVYDVWYYPDSGRWQRKESKANQVTNSSSIWQGGKTSGGYCGGTILGTVNGFNDFERIVRSTPLPGSNENCQSWVENVVRHAVNQGLLNSGALQKLRGIPRR